MGKIYTTDIVSIGGHSLDASGMVQIDALIADGLHSEAGYLTKESDTNTQLTDAQIAEMGYIKTYTDTDTNTQLTSAQIAAMGYLTEMPSHNHDDRHVREGGTSFSGVYPMVVRVSARNIYSDADITFTGSTSQLYVGGSIKSPIFYDSNNTGYYVNPAGTSNLNVINATGGTSTEWNTAHGWGNHADKGYLTSYIDTDTNTQLTSAQISAMGYTGDQTAAQIQSLGMARFYNNAVLNSSATTATFIAELISDYGCFANNQVTLKVQWSYAGSSNLVTDHATIGTIELAGCTIETWGGSYKHVRISRPNTGTGGHMVVEYNDQHSGYAPGWREIWTSESDGAGSGLDADLLDGQQGGYYYPASNPNNYTGDQNLSGYLTTTGKAADSNLLDGINSTSFLRSDADDAVNAGVTYTWARTDTAGLVFTNNSYNTKLYMGGWTTANSSNISRIRTSSGNLHIDSASNGNTYLNWYSGGEVKTNSILQSDASLRAPIFYDSNDTDYYGNFAGASRINQAYLTYLGVGTAANTSGGYRINMGGSINMNNNSIDYVTQLHFQDNVRFYDEGDDSYLNFKYGDSNAGGIRIRNGSSVQKGYLYADNSGFGLLDNDGQWAVRTQTGSNPLELRCNNNMEFQVHTSYTTSPGSSRAPIFYDSNDTTYYVDPASTGTALNIQGAIKVLSNHGGGNIELDYPYGGNTAYAGNMVMFMSEPGVTHDGGGIGCNIANNSPYYGRKYNHGYGVYLRFDKTGGNFEFWNTQSTAGNSSGRGTRRFYGDASGNTYSQSSSRAPTFYDSDNTGYYLNPASTSSLNELTVNGTITGNISGNASTLDNIDSGSFLRSDATDYQNNTIYQRGYLVNETSYRNRGVYGNYNSTKTNHIWSMGVAYKNHSSGTNFGNLYGLAYKHTNNTTGGNMAGGHQMVWCSNGTGRSAMGDNIWTSGNVKAPLYYDSNNTKYYLNPASTSNLNALTLAGTATASNFILSSDERKKTKIKDLPRNNINTNWKSFEMKNDEGEYRTGVIAQELEETHPEFVNTDSEGFKSVKYIDLLIAKIAELEARLEKLEK
jgi:hypothetical protein